MARWRMMLGAGGLEDHGSAVQLLLVGTSWTTMTGVFLAAGMFLVCAVVVLMVLALCAAHGNTSSVDGTESDCSFHEATAADGEAKSAAARNHTTPEQKHLGHNAAAAAAAGSNGTSGAAAHVSGTLNVSLSKMNSFRKLSFRKLDCKQVDVVEHGVGGKIKSAEHLYVENKPVEAEKPPLQAALAAEESSADSDVDGSLAAAAPAAPAVWQRAILRGNRCAPLAFSGLILYDEQGRPLRNFNTDREQPYQTHCRSQTIS